MVRKEINLEPDQLSWILKERIENPNYNYTSDLFEEMISCYEEDNAEKNRSLFQGTIRTLKTLRDGEHDSYSIPELSSRTRLPEDHIQEILMNLAKANLVSREGQEFSLEL